MRITQNMLNQNMLYNLGNNMERLSNYQEQLSTGKKLNYPTDDPIGTGLVMQYNAELTKNDQYTQNAGNAQSWLGNTDTLLSQASDVMQRVRELAVQGANGSNDPGALTAIAAEIGQLSKQLVQIGNSQFNGQYVFNGQQLDQAPYDPSNPSVSNPDTRSIQFQVDDNTFMPINVSGLNVFGSSTDSDNAFTVLQKLQNALNSGNTGAVSNLLSSIDSRMSKIESSRSDIGARVNRIQLIINRLSDTKLYLQQLRSNVQDANVAEVITNLKTAENVQQASLAAGARILVSTLADFLK